jgi:hypothetical protein
MLWTRYPLTLNNVMTDQNPSANVKKGKPKVSIHVVSAVAAHGSSGTTHRGMVGMIKKYKKTKRERAKLGGILYCFCPSV